MVVREVALVRSRHPLAAVDSPKRRRHTPCLQATAAWSAALGAQARHSSRLRTLMGDGARPCPIRDSPRRATATEHDPHARRRARESLPAQRRPTGREGSARRIPSAAKPRRGEPVSAAAHRLSISLSRPNGSSAQAETPDMTSTVVLAIYTWSPHRGRSSCARAVNTLRPGEEESAAGGIRWS